MRPFAMLCAFVIVAGFLRAEEEAAKLPQLDIIVTTKLNTNKIHMDNYTNSILIELNGLFPGLLRFRPVTKPHKDGEAQYRLAIDVSGTVTVGSNITSVAGKPDAKFVPDEWNRTFYLDARQQATANCRFLKWEDGKYKELLKWTAPFPKRPEEEKANGLVIVGVTSGKGSQQKDTGKPTMTLAQAQEMAIASMVPGSLTDVILSKLVEVKLVKADAIKESPGEYDAEVTVLNKSPWEIRSICVLLNSQGKVLTVGEIMQINFAEPLKSDPMPAKLTLKVKEVKEKTVKPGMRQVGWVIPQTE